MLLVKRVIELIQNVTNNETFKTRITPDDMVLKPDELELFLFQPVDSCQHFQL